MISPSTPRGKKANLTPASPFREPGWTVSKLKDELASRNLPKSGLKEELIVRLEEFDGHQPSPSISPSISQISSSKDSSPDKSSSGKRASPAPPSRSRSAVRSRSTSRVAAAAESRTRSLSTRRDFSPVAGLLKKSKSSLLLKAKDSELSAPLNLFTSPVETTYNFVLESVDLTVNLVSYLAGHRQIIAAALSLTALAFAGRTIDSPYRDTIREVETSLGWYLYWIALGIASSVGLGTGLHTFVLFLGPFIAKVTLKAYECGGVDFDLLGGEAFVCRSPLENVHVSLWAIYQKVMFASLAWGAGTAIGELPPYFVARAAALAGREDEEVDHIHEMQSKSRSQLSLWEKVQLFMFDLMQKLGFWGILLSASIPNPLFDLAGITCGHFMIPFATFFGATFIGKAGIKATIQTWFMIILFSRDTIEWVLKHFQGANPNLHAKVSKFLDSQKQQFSAQTKSTDPASVASIAWNGFITIMISYFVISIVNSLANARVTRLNKQKQA